METLLSIQNKIFYVNYKGAIRQAKFSSAVCLPNSLCGGEARVNLYWEVAGIEERKELWQMDCGIYYSVEDATDLKNEVEIEPLKYQTVNKYSENFYVSRNGYPHVFMWNGAMPIEVSLIYKLNNVRSELQGNKFVLVCDDPCSIDKLKAFYKTAEECKAHYRPKVVTF